MRFDQSNDDNRKKKGDLGEQTFAELLEIWFQSKITISHDLPDNMGVDLRCLIGSSLGINHQVSVDIQIKVRYLAEPKHSRIYDTSCFEISLNKYQINSLKKMLGGSGKALFVIGIATSSDFYELKEKAPKDRFNWYGIDIKQHLKRKENLKIKSNSIYIPLKNKINVGAFTLFWASSWFEKILHQVYSSTMNHDPIIIKTLKAFCTQSNPKLFNTELIKTYTRNLKKATTEMTQDEQSYLNFLLGTSIAQADIVRRIYNLGGTDNYKVYAVESVG